MSKFYFFAIIFGICDYYIIILEWIVFKLEHNNILG
jgi:hypothetical protein